MAEPPPDWAAYLGRKVSIRYRLRDDPEHPHSEAIGVVLSVVPSDVGARITVLTRKGEQIEVSADDVLAAKVF